MIPWTLAGSLVFREFICVTSVVFFCDYSVYSYFGLGSKWIRFSKRAKPVLETEYSWRRCSKSDLFTADVTANTAGPVRYFPNRTHMHMYFCHFSISRINGTLFRSFDEKTKYQRNVPSGSLDRMYFLHVVFLCIASIHLSPAKFLSGIIWCLRTIIADLLRRALIKCSRTRDGC